MPWGNQMQCGCPCGTGSYGGIGQISGCACPDIPAILSMTSADEACNSRMFQSCTIQYGPTDSRFTALNLPPNTFMSTASFPDPAAGGAEFYYYLTCQGNQFSLTRIYPTSPYGSPFRDSILYTWLIGGRGNTCYVRGSTQFRLDNGVAFPGSDASCGVTIDETY